MSCFGLYLFPPPSPVPHPQLYGAAPAACAGVPDIKVKVVPVTTGDVKEAEALTVDDAGRVAVAAAERPAGAPSGKRVPPGAAIGAAVAVVAGVAAVVVAAVVAAKKRAARRRVIK